MAKANCSIIVGLKNFKKLTKDNYDKDTWYLCFNGNFQRFLMVGKIKEDLFDEFMCDSGSDHMHCITHIAELPDYIDGIAVQKDIGGADKKAHENKLSDDDLHWT